MTNEVDLLGGSSGENAGSEKDRFQIQIDRVHYTVEQDNLTGAQLRGLVAPPIGPERDLFEVVPGGTDRKIEDATPKLFACVMACASSRLLRTSIVGASRVPFNDAARNGRALSHRTNADARRCD